MNYPCPQDGKLSRSYDVPVILSRSKIVVPFHLLCAGQVDAEATQKGMVNGPFPIDKQGGVAFRQASTHCR